MLCHVLKMFLIFGQLPAWCPYKRNLKFCLPFLRLESCLRFNLIWLNHKTNIAKPLVHNFIFDSTINPILRHIWNWIFRPFSLYRELGFDGFGSFDQFLWSECGSRGQPVFFGNSTHHSGRPRPVQWRLLLLPRCPQRGGFGAATSDLCDFSLGTGPRYLSNGASVA